jgi:hypothetical protein
MPGVLILGLEIERRGVARLGHIEADRNNRETPPVRGKPARRSSSCQTILGILAESSFVGC